ncbi:hypothetical protein Asp14428_63650 [Actinoplanes sp. NBRC 14428]|nr:hypothetical protein Asp14428_63650 [Actinoplanes sp. NBRC 14428]
MLAQHDGSEASAGVSAALRTSGMFGQPGSRAAGRAKAAGGPGGGGSRLVRARESRWARSGEPMGAGSGEPMGVGSGEPTGAGSGNPAVAGAGQAEGGFRGTGKGRPHTGTPFRCLSGD